MWIHTDDFFNNTWQHIGQGIIYGVISAILVNVLRPKPQIHICPQIAKYGDNRYKIKVINYSLFNAYTVEGYVKWYDSVSKSEFLTTLTTKPLLGRFSWLHPDQCELVTSIDPLLIQSAKIGTLNPDSDILIKYKDGTLTPEYFLEKNNSIEIILSATHSASGIKKIFAKSLKEAILGEWHDGQRKIKKPSKETR